MPTVWELITESSTLPEENDFWDHLNNLGSGTGGTGFVLVDTVEVEFMAEEVDVEVIDTTTDIEFVDDATDIEIVDDTIDVEISS